MHLHPVKGNNDGLLQYEMYFPIKAFLFYNPEIIKMQIFFMLT